MRPLDTKDVIKAIPLDTEVKEKLLAQFDSMEDGKKADITLICWDAFHKMRKVFNEAKYQEFMAEVGAGKREMNPKLNREAEDAAWQDIEDMISGKKEEDSKIADIRKQLQSFNTE